MKSSIVVVLVAALGISAALVTQAHAATPKERSLARQVKTLKAQVKALKTRNTTLKTRVTKLTTQNTTLTNERNGLAADKSALSGQVSTLTNERDSLQWQLNYVSGQLATAQQGAVATLGTMTESALYADALPAIAKVFLGGSTRYTHSLYSSSGYSSRTFDYCGFC